MSDWFSVDQIDADTFAIGEPRHWEETRCYLVCGRERALLIDTGMGIADVRAVAERLTPLPVMAAVTHAHWDHIGGLNRFDRFAVHEAEASWLTQRFPIPLSDVKRSLLSVPCDFPPDFDLDAYSLFRGTPQVLLHDGDRIELGARTLTVLHTPGHSPGHCCFYEPERKYLYTGDLIYGGRLDIFYPTTDPVQFRKSVRRVLSLDAERILPGHHRLDLSSEFIAKVDAALSELDAAGLLRHGSGFFDFGDFQIRL